MASFQAGDEPQEDRMEALYRDRVAQISDKLCLLHEGLDEDRNVRYESLQKRMTYLDERLNVARDAGMKRSTVIKEQLTTFQRELREEKITRESMLEVKNADYQHVLDDTFGRLDAEQTALQTCESRVMQLFEDKTSQLKAQIAKADRQTNENETTLKRYFEVDIPKLHSGLQEEARNREGMETRMLDGALEEVQQLRETIKSERKAREATEEAMMRMMEDVVVKMQTEIVSERQERERTEEMLLNLLHNTCTKLQVAAQSL